MKKTIVGLTLIFGLIGNAMAHGNDILIFGTGMVLGNIMSRPAPPVMMPQPVYQYPPMIYGRMIPPPPTVCRLVPILDQDGRFLTHQQVCN